LGGNASEPAHAGQCVEQTGLGRGYTPAVDNPVDNLWRTGPVLWITVGKRQCLK